MLQCNLKYYTKFCKGKIIKCVFFIFISLFKISFVRPEIYLCTQATCIYEEVHCMGHQKDIPFFLTFQLSAEPISEEDLATWEVTIKLNKTCGYSNYKLSLGGLFYPKLLNSINLAA